MDLLMLQRAGVALAITLLLMVVNLRAEGWLRPVTFYLMLTFLVATIVLASWGAMSW